MDKDSRTFLLGQLSQHKKDICDRVDKMEEKTDERFTSIEAEIKKLNMWRIKFVGFVAGIWATITFAKDILLAIYDKIK